MSEGATVAVGGFEITSNHESADEMVAALKPKEEARTDPHEVTPGTEAEEEGPKEKLSKAASELGKKGGEAAAAKRAREAQEAKPAKAVPKVEKDPDGADVDESKETPEDKPLGKPRDDPRARMLEATRQASELKKQLAQERSEREKLAAEVAAIRQAPPRQEQRSEPQAPQGRPQRPQMEQFETWEQYLDARDQWNRMQWAAEHDQAQSRRRYHETLDGHVNGFHKAISETRKTDPEFLDKISDEVLNLVPTFRLQGQASTAANWIADDFVFSPETAPALMLHFTEHPQEFQRIASLTSPRDVTREMAKLGARLDVAAAGTHSRPEVSKAKPPVRPVTGSPQTADSDVTGDLSFEEHVARSRARKRS